MKNITKQILIAIGFALLALVLWRFRDIVTYLIISFILSLIGKPLVRILEKIRIKKFRLSRSMCAAISLFSIWFFIFLIFRLLIPIIINEVHTFSNLNVDTQKFLSNFNNTIQTLETTINNFKKAGETPFVLKDFATAKVSSLMSLSVVTSIINSFTSAIGNIFIGIFSVSFITFFFLKDDNLFVNGLCLMFPSKYNSGIRHAISSINKLLGRYFIGIILEVILVMTFVTIGLSIVGLAFSHAIFIGFFAGMLNIIPYVGPLIGAVLGISIGTVINLNMDFYTQLLPLIGFMGIVFATVQICDNIFFQPLIYSSSVKAHPLEIFIVILAAGSIGGIIGMVLAIPVYTVLRVVGKEFFNNLTIVEKITKNI